MKDVKDSTEQHPGRWKNIRRNVSIIAAGLGLALGARETALTTTQHNDATAQKAIEQTLTARNEIPLSNDPIVYETPQEVAKARDELVQLQSTLDSLPTLVGDNQDASVSEAKTYVQSAKDALDILLTSYSENDYKNITAQASDDLQVALSSLYDLHSKLKMIAQPDNVVSQEMNAIAAFLIGSGAFIKLFVDNEWILYRKPPAKS